MLRLKGNTTMTAQNLRSEIRIQFHTDALAKKQARLETLVEGSPAYLRCLKSMDKDRAILTDVSAKLAARLESGKGNGPAYVPAKPRGPRKGQEFEIILGEEPEGDVMVPFSVRDDRGHFIKQA